MQLTLGFSPCPNDTFIFDALVHGRVAADGLRFDERLEDVETLNQLARRGELDVTKVSYGAIPYLLEEYLLLRSGGALGRGCGPLLVARPETEISALGARPIAIPGKLTTANLLLRLWNPSLPEGTEMLYSEIMPAVARGQVEAGLIIHESRFTYPDHGLVRLLDLGEWWEKETGLPIPLGGILARRSLGEAAIREVEAATRRSLEHAFRHPQDTDAYVRAHAQEMEVAVVRQHIELYVNRFSLELGEEGEAAVRELLARAAAAGLAPPAPSPFLPSRRVPAAPRPAVP
ncbi:1,4-dihydroxy-6-naphthoate synthase [soil metagenome]